MTTNTTSQKVRQGQETSRRLLNIARDAFATRGYAATKLDEVIGAAGLTKGALYHHFASKSALFEAVYREAEEVVADSIGNAVAAHADAWEQLRAGCFAYLDACSDPGLQRILRIDGPSVLGLARWAKIDREYGVERLLPALQGMSENGVLRVQSVEAFAWQLTGAMNEATFWVAQHPRPSAALRQSKQVLGGILESVRS